MAHKEKIDYLLLSLRELEKLIAGMRDMEIYPASFFSQCFSLSHRIIRDLHSLETDQLEELSRQIEEHRRLIESIPRRDVPMPAEEPANIEKPVIRQEEPATGTLPEIPAVPVAEEEAKVSDAPLLVPPPAAPVTGTESASPLLAHPLAEDPSAAEPGELTETVVSVPVAPGAGSREVPMARTRPVASPQLTIGEKPSISLNEVLEKKNLSDFRKAFSLNDRFRFRRELFGGDEEKMNRAVCDLNELHTFEDSIAYLHNELKWNVDDAAVADFIQLLEKRFS